MDCKKLKGFNKNCDLNINNIAGFFVFEFNDIDEYIYDSNDLDYIKRYSSISLPTYYDCNKKGVYSGVYEKKEYKMYSHELSVSFPKMDLVKRYDIAHLENKDMTIIFKTNNGECWIMGQDYPVQLSKNNITTDNYKLTFESIEKEQLKRIECPSESCFASFKARERIESIYIIEDASGLSYNHFEMVSFDSFAIINPLVSFQPSLWDSNPSVYATDSLEFSYLLTSLGTYISFDMIYDPLTDEITIYIISEDTEFGALLIDSAITMPTIQKILNFNTVLSIPIANGNTNIQLTDSQGIVFDNPYGSTLSLLGIAGTTDNFDVNLSSLYPNGTIFNIGVSNFPCANFTYEYISNPVVSKCLISLDTKFKKGRDIMLNIPLVTYDHTTPRFQNMSINICGVIFNIYRVYSDWHSNFNQFKNDIITKLYNSNIPIDFSSITIEDNGTFVSLRFRMIDENTFAKGYSFGLNMPISSNQGWLQSRLLHVDTIASYPSFIRLEDDLTFFAEGNNLTNITDSDFILEPNNNSIENVDIQWSFENNLRGFNTKLTVDSISPVCQIDTIASTNNGYSSFTSTNDTNYQILTLDTSGLLYNLNKSFELIYNIGGSNITKIINLSNDVLPDRLEFLTNELNFIKGLNILHAEYSALEQLYYIYVELDNISIVSLECLHHGLFFSMGSIRQIYHNKTNDNINPFVKLRWDLPTIGSNTTVGYEELNYGYIKQISQNIEAIFSSWNFINDELTLTRQSTDLEYNFIIGFYDKYPDNTNVILEYELPVGNHNASFSNIQLDFYNAGSNVNDIKYITYTNYLGWRYIQEINMRGSAENIFKERLIRPEVWGTLDSIKYLGTQTTTTPPDVL